MTVFIALPTLYTLAGIILAYPWFMVPVLVVVCAVAVDRRMRKRQAFAARADHDHRVLMARAIFAPHPLLPAPVTPRRRLSRPRGADHWSRTEPIGTIVSN
ncbi:hypothetical protein BST11_24915 [Mycobacterium alsense]|uniref:Uncharacterized protein n=1 Tax=Mycobacterium alsense TaxID=324058 RepID=A0AA42C3I2_9MYCO|nr:hypothetical protein [Mycobacterium alsense]MCV7382197.1 hypothetical protein [Mycobacterium alsense]OQZ88033.1 hypothetical protein BST11_24915 [Mycobacterium alsense]